MLSDELRRLVDASAAESSCVRLQLMAGRCHMRVDSSSEKSRPREAWRSRAARPGPLSGGSLSSFLPPRFGEGAGAMLASFLAMVAIGLAAFFGRGGALTEMRALAAGRALGAALGAALTDGRGAAATGLAFTDGRAAGLVAAEGRHRGAAETFEIRAGPDGRFFLGGGGGAAASSRGERRTIGAFGGLVIRRFALAAGGGGGVVRGAEAWGTMKGGRLVGSAGGAGGEIGRAHV